MASRSGKKLPRRDFVRLATTTAACGPFFLFPDRGLASQKTLKIAKWAHFVPGFDPWFEGELAREWGKQHDTNVVVDHIPVERINARASAEAAAGKGHDLFMFPWPPAVYQQHVIDHTEVYQSVAFKYGNVDRLGHRSTFDPKSKKYFAFCDSWRHLLVSLRSHSLASLRLLRGGCRGLLPVGDDVDRRLGPVGIHVHQKALAVGRRSPTSAAADGGELLCRGCGPMTGCTRQAHYWTVMLTAGPTIQAALT